MWYHPLAYVIGRRDIYAAWALCVVIAVACLTAEAVHEGLTPLASERLPVVR
jgi:hypothetical protein